MRLTPILFCTVAASLLWGALPSVAEEGGAPKKENASNPLAAVNNVDLRYQFKRADLGKTHDFFVDGAHMILPVLKFKYELRYKVTDVTGTTEYGFEKLVLKPIYFPYQTRLSEDVALRLAVGGELSLEFNNEDKGIGIGANRVAFFGAAAFMFPKIGLTVVPLIQQDLSFSGVTDVNTTTVRLIAIKSFENKSWLKVDLKIPFDHERGTVPASAELQLGYNLSKRWAVYIEGLVGIGNDRTFNGGVGVGVRFKY